LGDRGDAVAATWAGFAMGLVTAIGAAWPAARQDLHTPVAILGLVLAAHSIAVAVTASLTGPILGRWSPHRVFTVSALVASGCYVGIGVAPSWPVLFVSATALGVAFGPLDAGLNAYLAVGSRTRSMAWLHVGWGLGAVAGPATVAALEELAGSWRFGFGCFAIVMLSAALLACAVSWRQLPPSRDVPLVHDNRPYLAAALFFLYVGLETSIGSWSSTLLRGRGLSAAAAAAVSALYWGALTSGRVLLGVVGAGSRPGLIIIGCVVVAPVATLWLAASRGLPAVVALVIVGLCLAPLYPLLMLRTPSRSGATPAPAAVGLQSAAGTVGGAVIPGAIGAAVQAAGPGAIGPALLTVATGQLVALALSRTAASRTSSP
jgi:fucose permease